MWMFQGVLTYFQIRHYSTTLQDMKKEGKVLVGQHKGKFSSGSIIILVLDKENKIINAKEMRGMTVFNRFKTRNEFINKTLEEIKKDIPNMKNKKTSMSLKKAIEKA